MALDVESVMVEGIWIRHVPHGLNPLSRPDPPPDSRWQRGEIVDALYLADREETAWSEWRRHLAEAGLPPHVQAPRDLWTCEVESIQVADLSTAERLGRVGLQQPVPSRLTWPAYQTVGEHLWEEGWMGLLSPSAAWPNGSVLCLFVDADGRVSGVDPVPPPRTQRLAL